MAVALPRLGVGAYVVTWRVISADNHPVQGAFTFVVGDATPADAGEVEDLLGASGGSRVVGVAYGVGRSVAFATMLVLLGAVAFVGLAWPAGASSPRFRRISVVCLAVLAVATVLNVVLQGGYGAGLGLGDALSWSVISGVLRTRFGQVYELRLALLVAAAVLLWVLTRRPTLPRWWPWVAMVVGTGIAATPGLAGHAAVGSHQPFALLADVIHVGAAAVWLGGAVMLIAVLLPTASFDDATAAVTRYSQIALVAVGVLVATGLFQAWRQVGTLEALRTTDYGKLVVTKSLLVGAVLCFAYLSRRTLQRRWTPTSPATLRRTVSLEVAVAVGVLAVTSLLVNTVPAKVLAATPQSGELESATMLVDYTVAPARVGPNDIHLYALTTTGQPQPVVEMTLKLSLPERGIAPITVKLENRRAESFPGARLRAAARGTMAHERDRPNF